MVKNTFTLGFMMTLLGLGSYLASSTKSMTALIPLGIGAILMICSFFASRKEETKKTMMNFAALVTLVGLVAAAIGMPESYDMWQHGQSPLAFASQLITASVCLIFLMMYMRSFSEMEEEEEQMA